MPKILSASKSGYSRHPNYNRSAAIVNFCTNCTLLKIRAAVKSRSSEDWEYGVVLQRGRIGLLLGNSGDVRRARKTSSVTTASGGNHQASNAQLSTVGKTSHQYRSVNPDFIAPSLLQVFSRRYGWQLSPKNILMPQRASLAEPKHWYRCPPPPKNLPAEKRSCPP